MQFVEIAALLSRSGLVRAVTLQPEKSSGPRSLQPQGFGCFGILPLQRCIFIATKHHGKMPTFRGAAAVLQSCLLLNVPCVVCWSLASNITCRGGVGLVFRLQFSFVFNDFFEFHLFIARKLIMWIRSDYCLRDSQGKLVKKNGMNVPSGAMM